MKKSKSPLIELENLHEKITEGTPSLNESINFLKKVLSVRKKLDKSLFSKNFQVQIVKETVNGGFEPYDFNEV